MFATTIFLWALVNWCGALDVELNLPLNLKCRDAEEKDRVSVTLRDQWVGCPEGEVMQGFKVKLVHGYMGFKYRCCSMTPSIPKTTSISAMTALQHFGDDSSASFDAAPACKTLMTGSCRTNDWHHSWRNSAECGEMVDGDLRWGDNTGVHFTRWLELSLPRPSFVQKVVFHQLSMYSGSDYLNQDLTLTVIVQDAHNPNMEQEMTIKNGGFHEIEHIVVNMDRVKSIKISARAETLLHNWVRGKEIQVCGGTGIQETTSPVATALAEEVPLCTGCGDRANECWNTCGGRGYCDKCNSAQGTRGACCRQEYMSDPEECKAVPKSSFTVNNYHECVLVPETSATPGGDSNTDPDEIYYENRKLQAANAELSTLLRSLVN